MVLWTQEGAVAKPKVCASSVPEKGTASLDKLQKKYGISETSFINLG